MGITVCNKCGLIMEMCLDLDDKHYKMRRPRRLLGYAHHHKIHHRNEQGYNSMNHRKKVKIIKTKK